MDYDLIISGAGPVGLSLACALSGHGLNIALVEQQPLAALADPPFDGREIALTQHSAQVMRELGLWQHIDAHDQSPLRDAKVLNGPSTFEMVIGHDLSTHPELGWLVSNHFIRKAAFEAMQAAQQTHGGITLLASHTVTQVHTDALQARVTVAPAVAPAQSTGDTPSAQAAPRTLTARLLVAADSRFSTTRRALGIASRHHDFGRSMLVCEVTHAEPHHHVAWEWFDYGQTLALLPMNPDPATGLHRSSVVLTLPHAQIESVQHMPTDAFNQDITRRFAHRLGAMELISTRHVYPLVAVWPERIVAQRLACVGDAAVGMHPVTAHGFNFGLLSVEALARELRAAHTAGRDIAAPDALARYERAHKRATQPLYLITRLIARLYTDETPPARLLREAALRMGQRLTLFKRAVAHQLTG